MTEKVRQLGPEPGEEGGKQREEGSTGEKLKRERS